MLDDMIKTFIVHGCHGDALKYKEYVHSKSKSVKEEEIKGQWSYITELMIITIKSLIPSKALVGTVVDYTRFKQEMKLWYYYRHASNNLVIESSKGLASDIYWTQGDESIYARILPIVTCNTRWEIIKDEIIKNLLYTTGNIPHIFEAVTLARLLFLTMENIKDYEEVVSDLKEVIIHFGQKEFLLRYEDSLKRRLDTYPGNYTIDFERKKITLLNIFNGTSINNDYETLRNSIKLLKGDMDHNSIDVSNFWLRGFRGMVEDKDIDYNFKDRRFIESLGGYLFKLRKGRISPETLEISDYELPDIFSYSSGDEFSHTLLNRCRIIKKEESSNFIVSYVQTKTGVYRFFKRIN